MIATTRTRLFGYQFRACLLLFVLLWLLLPAGSRVCALSASAAAGHNPPPPSSLSSSSSNNNNNNISKGRQQLSVEQQQRQQKLNPESVLVTDATQPTEVGGEEEAEDDESTSSSLSQPRQLKTMDILSLDSIRSSLIRQEETIIFALIERAQFRQNDIMYKSGGFGDLGIPPGSCLPSLPLLSSSSMPLSQNHENIMAATTPTQQQQDHDGTDTPTRLLSFMEYMLVGTEALHCRARRYTSPEEHPFFPERLPDGPLASLPRLQYPPDLLSPNPTANSLNFNRRLLSQYLNYILPRIAAPGDDEQHGSSALCDIAILQALSRRVHYGKFVAESKYRSDPQAYQQLVEANDDAGVMALLTNTPVEEQVLRRARLKAATYGTEPLLAELPMLIRDRSSSTRNSGDRNSGAAAGNEDDTDDITSIVAAAAASAVVAALEAMNERKEDSSATTMNSSSSNDNNNNSNSKRRLWKGKVDPAAIEAVYRDVIIPLTKDVEVAYLFRRCGKDPPSKQYLP